MGVHIGSRSAVVPDSLQFIQSGYDNSRAATEKKQPPAEKGTTENIRVKLSACLLPNHDKQRDNEQLRPPENNIHTMTTRRRLRPFNRVTLKVFWKPSLKFSHANIRY